MSDLVVGPDGLARCGWCHGQDDYVRYHDSEWGRPVRGDDDALFERIALEGFQSGLSWRVILAKRDAFREAFRGFSVDAVATFGERDVTRLMGDSGIVRNRAKITATIANARAVATFQRAGGSLSDVVWSFAPAPPPAPASLAAIPAATPESAALADALRAMGLRFVGPTTMYALMQAIGLVNDHIDGCFAREAIADEQRRFGAV